MANYASPAEYVTWMGHVSEATLVAKYGAEAITADVTAGLIEPSRLGGYVATRKGNAEVFGQGFNALIDGLVDA